MSAGSPGPSLWSASVAAAQARGESASLYAPPMQTPQAAKLYTGFGLEQEPAQARPLADSFLQIDRCAAPPCTPPVHNGILKGEGVLLPGIFTVRVEATGGLLHLEVMLKGGSGGNVMCALHLPMVHPGRCQQRRVPVQD